IVMASHLRMTSSLGLSEWYSSAGGGAPADFGGSIAWGGITTKASSAPRRMRLESSSITEGSTWPWLAVETGDGSNRGGASCLALGSIVLALYAWAERSRAA